MKRAIWIGLSGLLFALPAGAQESPERLPESESAPALGAQPVEQPAMGSTRAPSGFRASPRAGQPRSTISVGTGMLSYFSGNAPGTSWAWDARYRFNASRLISVEAGYVGAIGDSGPGGAAIATIIEGDVLVKPLMLETFNPFVVAGAGWGNFNDTGDNAPDADNTFIVPLGVGAEYRFSDRIVADGRFTYRLATADSWGPREAELDNWALVGRVGTQF